MKNKLLKTIIMLSKCFLYGLVLQTLLLNLVFALNANGQYKNIEEVRVTLSAEQLSLNQFFREVQRQTPFKFSYEYRDVDRQLSVTFAKKEGPVIDFLREAAQQSQLSFRQVNHGIDVLKRKGSGEALVSTADITISGRVTDENGEGLPGATVTVAGTTTGTVTDLDGNYSLTVPENSILVFSFIGYEAQRISLDNRSVLNVIMAPDLSSLEEVVVVGYGEVKKRDFTGSVASIKESQLKGQPINSFDQALQGRVAGVQITQASNAPGGGITIRVRGGNSISGSNDPLYVIDGFPVTNPAPAASSGNATIFANPLSSINPNDIESIEVLKDASATAIYGSRGANGVVLVTTKRGKEGSSSVEYETYYGLQQITKTLDLVNGEEHVMLKNEQLKNLGFPQRYGEGLAENGRPFLYPAPATYGEGTDWQKEIFRTAAIKNHQLTLTGGNERIRYLVSGNYFDQDGIVISSNFKRYTSRINLDIKVSNKINVGSNVTLSRGVNNSVNEVGNNSLVGLALSVSPASPIYDESGGFQLLNVGPGSGFSGRANPVAVANTTTNELITDRVLANVFGDVQLAEGLSARFSFGVDVFNSRRNLFYTPETLIGNNLNGYGSNGNSNNLNLLNENTITYSKSIANHTFNMVAGITFQSNKDVRTLMQAQNFPNFTLGAGNLGLANTPLPPNGSIDEWGLNSYLSRINYTFKDKYLFTVTGRVDGSSRFGINNKYAFFPSGAIAWRISDEEFLKGSNLISDLKLRTSFGSTGNDGIGLYQSLSQYNTARTVFNDVEVITNQAGRIANPDLKWEITNQFNVGLDLSFVENRFQFTADYYIKTTRDLLLNVQLPATTGFTGVLKNVGSMQNKGLELALNTVNTVGELKWSTNANISFNQNKVLKLADAEEFILNSGFNTLIVREGEPLGSFFGNVFDGIWQTQEEINNAGGIPRPGDRPGALRFKDLDGDGVFNEAADRTILGNGLPSFFYGLTNNFNYKKIDLSIFIQGVQGNQIYNSTRRSMDQSDPSSAVLKDVFENAWRADRPSERYPSIRQWRWPNTVSYFVEDGSFIRLKNVTLGYTIPVNTPIIKNVRLYFSGQNLLTWTKYSGFDPEVNSNFNSNVSYGVDAFAYPLARTFMIGGNFKF